MKKMVIFDLLLSQSVGRTMFHGGGEYIKTVFQVLMNGYDGTYDLIACYDTDRFMEAWVLDLIREKSVQVVDVKTVGDIVRVVGEKADHAEVRFFTGIASSYSHYSLPEKATCIGTCHGLRGVEKPYDRFAALYIQNKSDLKEFIKYTIFNKRTKRMNKKSYESILKRFDIIITDSAHSAFSLKVNFPTLMEDREVKVYFAPEKYVAPLTKPQKETKERYILMISANRWLKNSYRGITALDGLYQKGLLRGIKTKVYGNLPERIRKRIKCKDSFDFLGYVNTEELEHAYRDCTVFFYPTLNEGFGLPPMEAMKYGKTCVISNVCSLPEIYGESVFYCNPYDVMEMQNRILQAIDSPIEQIRITDHLKKIREKQRTDTECLCRLIHGGSAGYIGKQKESDL